PTAQFLHFSAVGAARRTHVDGMPLARLACIQVSIPPAHHFQETSMSARDRRSTRRDLLRLSAAGLAAGLAPWSAFAQTKKLIVGVIYVGPKDDYGYNQAQAAA